MSDTLSNIEKFNLWATNALNEKGRKELKSLVYRNSLNKKRTASAAQIGLTSLKDPDTVLPHFDALVEQLKKDHFFGKPSTAVKNSDESEPVPEPSSISDSKDREIASLKRQLAKSNERVLKLRIELAAMKELKQVVVEMGLFNAK